MLTVIDTVKLYRSKNLYTPMVEGKKEEKEERGEGEGKFAY